MTLASTLAGFVDAIVGGGGLILVPALFATYLSASPATLLGTNKSASVWGTLFALWQYSKRIELPWRKLWIAVIVTWVGSWLGAYTLTLISPDFLRKLLPVVMLLVLIYTLMRKDLGHTHAPRWTGRHETWALCGIGLVIGYYDGFFGPGTGTFLVFALVRGFGFDFLPCCPCFFTPRHPPPHLLCTTVDHPKRQAIEFPTPACIRPLCEPWGTRRGNSDTTYRWRK